MFLLFVYFLHQVLARMTRTERQRVIASEVLVLALSCIYKNLTYNFLALVVRIIKRKTLKFC